MRTPEEIMKAMEFCTTHETCEGCPYQMYNTDKLGYDEPICVNRLLADTICHVRQLEANKNELLAECKQLKETVTGAAPMVRARWDFRCRHIRTEIWEWHCSACGELPPGDNRLAYTLNYCPNCGAKMDGGADSGKNEVEALPVLRG